MHCGTNRDGLMHRLHCFTMALLYLCQGLVAGSLSSLPVLLTESVATFTSTQAAILALPMYVFTAKFLWAPIVDRCYSRYLAGETRSATRTAAATSKATTSAPSGWTLHRRVQFVVPLQLLMTSFFALLMMWSGPLSDYRDETFLQWIGEQQGALSVTALFFGLALCSATQDISVDAWAVEGMSTAEESSLAGTLQMVGLICGSTLCQAYVMMRRYLPLYAFFGCCGATCIVAGACALFLGVVHRPKALQPPSPAKDTDDDAAPSPPGVDSSSVMDYAGDIFRAPRARAFVWILLTRGWPYALMPLLTLRLQAHHVIDATLLAQLRMVGTLISVATGTFVSARVIERLSSQGTLRLNSRCDFILCLISAAMYLIATEDLPFQAAAGSVPEAAAELFAFPYISKEMYVGLVVALTLLASIIGATSFVAVVVQSSTEAACFPKDAATTITLFNAMANLGYTLPSSIIMFSVDPLARWLSQDLQLPSSAIADRASIGILTVVLFSFALLVRRLYLVPSVALLGVEVKRNAKKAA